MEFPACPFDLGKIRPEVRPDAVLTPERRLRHTMRDLHHILYFEIGPTI